LPTDLPGRPRNAQLLGYAALIEHDQLVCPPPRRLTALASVSQKSAIVREGVEWLLMPRGARFRIPETPIEHRGVALKHESLNLRTPTPLAAASSCCRKTCTLRSWQTIVPRA